MKIIVIGATGLVGHFIVQKCLQRNDVTDILLFVRRKSQLSDPRIHEHIVDFDKIQSWSHLISGDVLFSALGTTLKVAGSKEAQLRVDFDYQLEVAKAAAANKISSYVLISSVNADPRSVFFYLKIKGLLEEEVSKLTFSSISLLRPGPLKGEREAPRLSEIISNKILDLMPKVLVTPGVRPVSAQRVAEVAVQHGLNHEKGIRIVGPKKILSA